MLEIQIEIIEDKIMIYDSMSGDWCDLNINIWYELLDYYLGHERYLPELELIFLGVEPKIINQIINDIPKEVLIKRIVASGEGKWKVPNLLFLTELETEFDIIIDMGILSNLHILICNNSYLTEYICNCKY